MLRESLSEGRVGKNALDAVLRVVKIAFCGEHHHVVACLRRHLAALDAACAAVGIEYADFCTRHTGETFKRRFACIAGGRHENDDRFVHACLFQGSRQQKRQKLEREILKGAGRPVKQLKDIRAVAAERYDRRDSLGQKLAFCIGAANIFRQLAARKVR